MFLKNTQNQIQSENFSDVYSQRKNKIKPA